MNAPLQNVWRSSSYKYVSERNWGFIVINTLYMFSVNHQDHLLGIVINYRNLENEIGSIDYLKDYAVSITQNRKTNKKRKRTYSTIFVFLSIQRRCLIRDNTFQNVVALSPGLLAPSVNSWFCLGKLRPAGHFPCSWMSIHVIQGWFKSARMGVAHIEQISFLVLKGESKVFMWQPH